jgi:hypothetical protein
MRFAQQVNFAKDLLKIVRIVFKLCCNLLFSGLQMMGIAIVETRKSAGV